MRVLRGEVTLSVQDLVCDGCRGVAVEGGFVGGVSGVWHCCGLLMGLCGWFWLPWWALVGCQCLVWRQVGWLVGCWRGCLFGVGGARGGYVVCSRFGV